MPPTALGQGAGAGGCQRRRRKAVCYMAGARPDGLEALLSSIADDGGPGCPTSGDGTSVQTAAPTAASSAPKQPSHPALARVAEPAETIAAKREPAAAPTAAAFAVRPATAYATARRAAPSPLACRPSTAPPTPLSWRAASLRARGLTAFWSCRLAGAASTHAHGSECRALNQTWAPRRNADGGDHQPRSPVFSGDDAGPQRPPGGHRQLQRSKVHLERGDQLLSRLYQASSPLPYPLSPLPPLRSQVPQDPAARRRLTQGSPHRYQGLWPTSVPTPGHLNRLPSSAILPPEHALEATAARARDGRDGGGGGAITRRNLRSFSNKTVDAGLEPEAARVARPRWRESPARASIEWLPELGGRQQPSAILID